MSLSFPTMAAIRFGYGFRPGETPPKSKDDLLDQIWTGANEAPAFPVGGIDARRADAIAFQQKMQDIRKSQLDDTAKEDERRKVRQVAQRTLNRDVNARIMQAVLSPNGFYERLAVFWSDHFSVSTQKTEQMRLLVPLYEAEAIRPFVGNSFSALLKSATTHPAMLIYLDQNQSQGPESQVGMKQKKGLNENLGRELLELHTLGAGSGYTQADVRAAAMVLTGVTLDREAVDAVFRPGLAEPGSHAVMGVSYGGERRTRDDYLSMLDDLSVNPRTATHISRKLAAHFVSDQPPDDMIAAMAAEWKRTDGDLMAVYGAMLDHPAAWSNEGSKARQPFDFVVAGQRALDAGDGKGVVGSFMQAHADDEDAGMPANAPGMQGMQGMMASPDMKATPTPQQADRKKAFQAARALGQGALRRMGQPIWMPPSPAGFPEDFQSWITASQLSERLAWSRRAAAQFGEDLDPREFLRATLADAARADTIQVVSQAPSKIAGVSMVMASPEFNRR